MLFVQIFDLCQINERGKNMTILKTENLKKIYGDGANAVRALDGVSIIIAIIDLIFGIILIYYGLAN